MVGGKLRNPLQLSEEMSHSYIQQHGQTSKMTLSQESEEPGRALNTIFVIYKGTRSIPFLVLVQIFADGQAVS